MNDERAIEAFWDLGVAEEVSSGAGLSGAGVMGR